MNDEKKVTNPVPVASQSTSAQKVAETDQNQERPREYGGPKGLEPTRFGDWERNGRVSDF